MAPYLKGIHRQQGIVESGVSMSVSRGIGSQQSVCYLQFVIIKIISEMLSNDSINIVKELLHTHQSFRQILLLFLQTFLVDMEMLYLDVFQP